MSDTGELRKRAREPVEREAYARAHADCVNWLERYGWREDAGSYAPAGRPGGRDDWWYTLAGAMMAQLAWSTQRLLARHWGTDAGRAEEYRLIVYGTSLLETLTAWRTRTE